MVPYDYYRIFYHVARCGSFTKASVVLNNSQSNITRYINLLEHELGARLLERSHRGVSLTPEGKKLYEHVSVAYEQLRTGEEEVRTDSSLEGGIVTIACSEIALQLHLLERMERFHQEHPKVRIRLISHATPGALASVVSGLVDFALVTTPLSAPPSVEVHEVAKFKVMMIGGSKYHALSEQTLSLENIVHYPLITLREGTSSREFDENLFLEHGLSFVPDMEAFSSEQVLPMVEHNLGLGFCPEELAKEARKQEKVVRIPLKEEIPQRSICMLRGKNRSFGAAALSAMESVLR